MHNDRGAPVVTLPNGKSLKLGRGDITFCIELLSSRTTFCPPLGPNNRCIRPKFQTQMHHKPAKNSCQRKMCCSRQTWLQFIVYIDITDCWVRSKWSYDNTGRGWGGNSGNDEKRRSDRMGQSTKKRWGNNQQKKDGAINNKKDVATINNCTGLLPLLHLPGERKNLLASIRRYALSILSCCKKIHLNGL